MSSLRPLPGTRPRGANDDAEAARNVRDMFSEIAPRYDLLNHVLSLSLDRVWRRRTARRFRHVLHNRDAVVLDMCCGTGDLAFALAKQAASGPAGGARIVASDFALPMLNLAMQKLGRRGLEVSFMAADSLELPFPDASLDLVTAAFGFRNLANYERGLGEIARVLRRGGEVAILEFCEPRSDLLAPLYRFYFKSILPRIGGAISSGSAYAYLPASVVRFPPPAELARMMERAGFGEVRFEVWNFGVVGLHAGRKA
jgi:demethylmenaquinone methyltransferase / 2-methoxy-6-polyprenyl-1,4-benzoquinol methylase